MRNEELKKCPFCGGEASLIVKDVVGKYMAQYHCKGCVAMARPSKLYEKYDAAVAEARDIWNRRVD